MRRSLKIKRRYSKTSFPYFSKYLFKMKNKDAELKSLIFSDAK